MQEQLTPSQRELLQIIFDFFNEKATWPNYQYLSRLYIKLNPDIDIDEMIQKFPPGLIAHVDVNDPKSLFILNVVSVFLCRDSERILADFILIIQFCVDIFFNPDSLNLRISSQVVAERYNWDPQRIKKVGYLLLGEPQIWQSFGGPGEDSTWSAEITKGIRRFRGVTTLQEYLECRIPKSSQQTSIAELQAIPTVGIIPNPELFPSSEMLPGGGILSGKQTTATSDPNAPPLIAATIAPNIQLPTATTPSPALQPQSITVAIRALTDAPSTIDLLGFSDYTTAITDFIENENTEKPLTLVIDASWGMGKTTLMSMIRTQLEAKAKNRKKKSVFTVWFNAWKYDQAESLWAALALGILDEVSKHFNFFERIGFWFKLNRQRFDWNSWIFSILKSLLYIGGLSIIGFILFLIASLWPDRLPGSLQKQLLAIGSGLSALIALYTIAKNVYSQIAKPFDLNVAKYMRKPNYQNQIGFLAEFEEDFKLVIDAVTQNGKWPLVVFIDDLDRCAPPKPVEIIEAINILLDSKCCIFIIGMDMQMVAKSIETKYKDLSINETANSNDLTIGQRFLEKIVQITLHIPRINSEGAKTFVNAHLNIATENSSIRGVNEEIVEAKQLIKSEQRTGKSLEAAAETVQENNPKIPAGLIIQAKQEIFAKTFDDSEDVRGAINKVIPYLGYNPRKIKRFINNFRLQTLIANRRNLLANGSIRLELLAKWIVITTRWPSFVEAIATDAKLLEKYDELKVNLIVSTPPKVSEEEIKRKIGENMLGNYYLKKIAGIEDLQDMLFEMTSDEIQSLPSYLHLTQTTL